MLVTPNLKGYWRFEGNANDSSGNGNDGTVYGASLTTGEPGNILSNYDFSDWTGSYPEEYGNISMSEVNKISGGTGNIMELVSNGNNNVVPGEGTAVDNAVRQYEGSRIKMTIRAKLSQETAPGYRMQIQEHGGTWRQLLRGPNWDEFSSTEWKEISREDTIDLASATNQFVLYYRLDATAENPLGVQIDWVKVEILGGKFGQCYYFDGSDDYITTSLTDEYNALTVCGWVKLSSLSNGCVLGRYNTIDNRVYSLYFISGASPRLIFIVSPTGLYHSNYTAEVAYNTTGEWVFVAGVWNGTRSKIYLNAILEDTSIEDVTSMYTSNVPLEIGHFNNDIYDFDGLIDEVMIFSTALSQSDIKRVMLGMHPLNG